jgi:hypothetical protein
MSVSSTYQQKCQRSYETTIAYKEQFNFVLKSYHEQGNAELKDPDVAMDFFEAWIMQDTK